MIVASKKCFNFKNLWIFRPKVTKFKSLYILAMFFKTKIIKTKDLKVFTLSENF